VGAALVFNPLPRGVFAGPELKVLGAVVIANAVSVMDVLIALNRATKHLLHDDQVLERVAALVSPRMVCPDIHLPVPVGPPRLPATLLVSSSCLPLESTSARLRASLRPAIRALLKPAVANGAGGGGRPPMLLSHGRPIGDL
jgi:hypothetical protein